MNDSPGTTGLRPWLDTKPAAALMKSLSQRITRKLIRSRIPLPFQDIPTASESQFDEIVPIVLSELTVFLLDNEMRLNRYLSGVPDLQWGRVLETAFFNHLKDRVRHKTHDPFRYLYRRVSDVLRKTDRFHLDTRKGGGMTVALIADAPPVGPILDEDLADIPVPKTIRDQIPADGGISGTALVSLADHALTEMARIWEMPAVRVRVTDLVRWLYRLMPPELRVVSLPDQARPEIDSNESFENRIADPVGDAERCWFDREKVAAWARQAADRLSPNEARIAFLYHGEGKTLALVAEALGKKSASSVHYHIDNILLKLKSILRDRPWLSPEDLNPEAFSFFWEEWIEELKKRCATPLIES